MIHLFIQRRSMKDNVGWVEHSETHHGHQRQMPTKPAGCQGPARSFIGGMRFAYPTLHFSANGILGFISKRRSGATGGLSASVNTRDLWSIALADKPPVTPKEQSITPPQADGVWKQRRLLPWLAASSGESGP